eukprot:TRINITY_DN1246_c0_g1_i1.p1 TRINITY_DN1246_c0_g1~~TRINITY_DN1246_c0_g1_i1.p1  ORF type:complete len:192 (+),score=71.75 TRINITY_DN1246_c0_g1_i1:266-841(+)
MKTIHSTRSITIPKEVTVSVKSRVITVVGPRGKLTRNFRHLQCDVSLSGKAKVNQKLTVDVWFGTRREIACIRTLTTHVENMITGVTKGYEYHMKFASAHFPINVNIPDGGKEIEIRNFLGEKIIRRVEMLNGVIVNRSESKDEIVLTGNDLEKVSQSAANIHQSTKVHNKDIRKFLDGIYVSDKGVIGSI